MTHTPTPVGIDIWIVDSSALIQTKREIAAQHQWAFFERLKAMVENGVLCFPRGVRTELHAARHVDTPEAWALDVAERVQQFYDPPNEDLVHVMEVAGDVVDVDAEADPADPYVLAQARAISRNGAHVCVVTNDLVDRQPIKIALSTAADRLNLDWCTLNNFMAAIGFDPARGWRVP